MKYLLDTNICVHLLRGRRDIAEAIDRVGLSNCGISEITEAELLVGQNIAERKGIKVNRQELNVLLAVMDNVPVSKAIEYYSEEKARLLCEGTPIEDFDLLIACTAVISGAVLITENSAHMSRVSGVRIENWVTR